MITKNLLMRDSIKANKFLIFSSIVTNLLYEKAYLEINRLETVREFYLYRVLF